MKQKQSTVSGIPFVPKKYAGKWIVWSKDGVTIIGSGPTPEAALETAKQLEPTVGGYEWVPPADQYCIGKSGV